MFQYPPNHPCRLQICDEALGGHHRFHLRLQPLTLMGALWSKATLLGMRFTRLHLIPKVALHILLQTCLHTAGQG